MNLYIPDMNWIRRSLLGKQVAAQPAPNRQWKPDSSIEPVRRIEFRTSTNPPCPETHGPQLTKYRLYSPTALFAQNVSMEQAYKALFHRYVMNQIRIHIWKRVEISTNRGALSRLIAILVVIASLPASQHCFCQHGWRKRAGARSIARTVSDNRIRDSSFRRRHQQFVPSGAPKQAQRRK